MKRFLKITIMCAVMLIVTCICSKKLFALGPLEEDPYYPTPTIIHQYTFQSTIYSPWDVPSIGNCFDGSKIHPINTKDSTILLINKSKIVSNPKNSIIYNGALLSSVVEPYKFTYANDGMFRYVIETNDINYNLSSCQYEMNGFTFEATEMIYRNKEKTSWYAKNSYRIYIEYDSVKYYLAVIYGNLYLIDLTDPYNKYTLNDISVWTVDESTFFYTDLCFLRCSTKESGKNYYLYFDKETQDLAVKQEVTSLVCVIDYKPTYGTIGLWHNFWTINPVIRYVTTLKNGKQISYYRIWSKSDAFFDAGIMNSIQEDLWDEYNGSEYEYNKTRSGYVGIKEAESKFTFEQAIKDIDDNNVATEPSEKVHTYYKGYGYTFDYNKEVDGTEDVPEQHLWANLLQDRTGDLAYLMYIWRQYPVKYSFTGLAKGLKMEVLTGSPLSDHVYDDCLNFKSGDYLIEHTWIAFTLPDYLACGYKYQWNLDSLCFYDENGKEYGKDTANNYMLGGNIDSSQNKTVEYKLVSRYHADDTLLVKIPSNGIEISCSVFPNYTDDGQMANKENLYTYISGLDSQKAYGQTVEEYSVQGSTGIYTQGIKVSLSNNAALDSMVNTYQELIDPYSKYYNYTYTWYEKIIPEGETGSFIEWKEINYAKNKREFTYKLQESSVHSGDTIAFYCKVYKRKNMIWNSFDSTVCSFKVEGDRFDIQLDSIDANSNILSDKIYIYLDNYDSNFYEYRTLFNKTNFQVLCDGSYVFEGKSIIDQNRNTLAISAESNDLHSNSNATSISLNETIDAPKAYSYVITKNGQYSVAVSDGSTIRTKTINVTNIAENPVVDVIDVDNTEEIDSDYVYITADASIFKRIAKAEVSKDGGEYSAVGFKAINSDKDFLKNNSFFTGSAYKYEITGNGTYTFRLTDINGVSIVSEPIVYTNIGAAHNHELHKADGTLLKCGVAGNGEYYYCEDCEKVFDKNGSELNYEVIFPNYPDRCEYEDVVIETHASTCIEAGYEITEEVCKHCGYHKENSQKLRYLELADHTAGSEYYYDSLYHYNLCTLCGEKTNIQVHEYGNDNVCDICNFRKLSTPTISVNSLLNKLKYGENGEISFDISFQGMRNDIADYDIIWYQDSSKAAKTATPSNINIEKTNTTLKFTVKDNKFIDAETYYFAISAQNEGKDVVSNVASLIYTKRDITLTSASFEHEYDTCYFKCEDVTVSGDGFAYGEGFVYSNFNSIFAGTADNTFNFVADDNTNPSNYNVTQVYGTLTTTAIKANGVNPIWFIAIGGSKVYDGKALTPVAFEVIDNTKNGDEIIVSEYTEGITNVNTTTKVAKVKKSGIQILHGSVDVTKYYVNCIKITEGATEKNTLTVTKRPITVKSVANDKAIITSGTLADNQTISFEDFNLDSDQIKFVAKIFDAEGNETSSNYDITYVYGNDVSLDDGLNTTDDFYNIVGDYDGHAYSADLKNLYVSYLSTNNYELRFFVDDSSEYTLDEPSRTEAGQIDVLCKAYDKTKKQYVPGSSVRYSIIVNKRNVTIHYSAADKTYDGSKIFPGSTMLDGNFVNDEGIASFTFTAASADVATGYRMCSFAYVLKSNTNADNYNITTSGDINYQVKVNPAPLILESQSASKVYDGTPLAANNMVWVDKTRLVQGHTVEAVLEASITNVGDISNDFTSIVVKDENNVDISSNYTITNKVGSLSVLPREITITSQDAKKTYDGTGLYNHSTVVTSGSLVSGDEIECENFATIIDAGTVFNSFDIVSNPNYKVTKKYGTLTVEKAPITLKSASKTKTYDGTALVAESVEIIEGHFCGEDSFVYKFYGNQLSAGSSSNSFVVSGNCLKNYRLTKEEGTLTVTPITNPITVTSLSESKVYDGTALKGSSYKYTDGVLLAGDELVIKLSEITNAGSVSNKIKSLYVYRGDEDVTSSYTFANPVLGTLRVIPKEVLITPNDVTITYGETPKFSAKVTGLLNNDSVDYVFDINGASDAGTYPVKVKAEKYQGNYLVTSAEGTLTILKDRTMTLSASSLWAYYSGKELSQNPSCNIDGAVISYQIKENEEDEYGESSTEIPKLTNASRVYVLATASHKNYESTSAEYYIEIVKSLVDAPKISVHSETYLGQNDGYVSGISTDMEYKVGGDDTYYPITKDMLINKDTLMLNPGVYSFRYKDNANHYASQLTVIEIAEGRKIKVTYNGNLIQECKYGEKISAPTYYEKEGYVFAGFHCDPNYTYKWDFDNDRVSEDITLYALYQSEAKEYANNNDDTNDNPDIKKDDEKKEDIKDDPNIQKDNDDENKNEEIKKASSIIPISIGGALVILGGAFVIIKKKGKRE